MGYFSCECSENCVKNRFFVCLQRNYYVVLLKLWVNKVVEHLSSMQSKLYFILEIWMKHNCHYYRVYLYFCAQLNIGTEIGTLFDELKIVNNIIFKILIIFK